MLSIMVVGIGHGKRELAGALRKESVPEQRLTRMRGVEGLTSSGESIESLYPYPLANSGYR